MHVNYNPELVALIREVRHLSLLGYKIPIAIQEAADLAKQFMRQAKSLQQVIYLREKSSLLQPFLSSLGATSNASCF